MVVVLHLHPLEQNELFADSAQFQNTVVHCPPVAKPSKAILVPEYFGKLSRHFHSPIHLDMYGMPILEWKWRYWEYKDEYGSLWSQGIIKSGGRGLEGNTDNNWCDKVLQKKSTGSWKEYYWGGRGGSRRLPGQASFCKGCARISPGDKEMEQDEALGSNCQFGIVESRDEAGSRSHRALHNKLDNLDI